eukprot:scaffold21458_cov167-Amphora_coffeaeformis.AAC.1
MSHANGKELLKYVNSVRQFHNYRAILWISKLPDLPIVAYSCPSEKIEHPACKVLFSHSHPRLQFRVPFGLDRDLAFPAHRPP